MIKDYFILSFKNLKRRGLRSWLTLLGILIGVATVIALISLGNGLKLAVNSQFGIEDTTVISVQAGGLSGYGPPGSFVVKPLTTEDAKAISKISSIEFAVPRIIKSFKGEFNNKLNIVFAASVPEDKINELYSIQNLEAESGRLIAVGDRGKVFLGNNFKDPKNEFGKAIMPGNTITIEGKSFRVIGIMKKKGSFILDNVIMMPEADMKALLNNSDAVSVIGAKVKNKNLMAEAEKDINDLMRQRRNVKKGEEDFEVSTPEATLKTINQILTGIQMFIALIASISILIGAIGIINTMMTSVMERKKEIGIMKAIGAKNEDIFVQFFIEAGMLGLIGGLIGIIIGTTIGFIGTLEINKYIGASSQPNLNFILIFASLAGSFLIGAIAGISPAIKAAKQNPVEAIRN